MLIAKIDKLEPIDYRAAFPNTSFSVNGPSDEFLSDHGYAKVNVFREHDRVLQKLVPTQPYYESPWVYTVAVENKTQEELDREIEQKAIEVRSIRNKKLQESDWTQMPDVEIDKYQWIMYRKALRDISLQEGFPLNINWPTEPV